jgi:hypothetical protein
VPQRDRGAQIPGTRSPWPLHFVRWRLIFVGTQYGTCFMSPCWRQEYGGGSQILGKFVHLCSMSSVSAPDGLLHSEPRTGITLFLYPWLDTPAVKCTSTHPLSCVARHPLSRVPRHTRCRVYLDTPAVVCSSTPAVKCTSTHPLSSVPRHTRCRV